MNKLIIWLLIGIVALTGITAIAKLSKIEKAEDIKLTAPVESSPTTSPQPTPLTTPEITPDLSPTPTFFTPLPTRERKFKVEIENEED